MKQNLGRLYASVIVLPSLCCWLVYVFVSPPHDPWWLLGDGWAFLMILLVYPIIEELTFRGVIQGALDVRMHHREALLGITWANLMTSGLFVAIHFVHHPPLLALSVIVPSLIFGYVRDRTGSVIPPMLLHAFYNGLFNMAIGTST
jgi:membrane protease YdiL (CAAX protease family)